MTPRSWGCCTPSSRTLHLHYPYNTMNIAPCFKLEQHVCFYCQLLRNKFECKLKIINALLYLRLARPKPFSKHVNCMFTRDNHSNIRTLLLLKYFLMFIWTVISDKVIELRKMYREVRAKQTIVISHILGNLNVNDSNGNTDALK